MSSPAVLNCVIASPFSPLNSLMYNSPLPHKSVKSEMPMDTQLSQNTQINTQVQAKHGPLVFHSML